MVKLFTRNGFIYFLIAELSIFDVFADIFGCYSRDAQHTGSSIRKNVSCSVFFIMETHPEARLVRKKRVESD